MELYDTSLTKCLEVCRPETIARGSSCSQQAPSLILPRQMPYRWGEGCGKGTYTHLSLESVAFSFFDEMEQSFVDSKKGINAL